MRRSLEQNLALIEELRGDGEKARPELAKMLKHKNNFLVARASEVAAELGLEDLYPLIEEAFFRFVEAMAASGLTGGCAPGSFCPDQPVTRGQMSVFLSLALGLHFPN